MNDPLFMVHFHWQGESEALRASYDAVLEKVVALQPARPMVHLAYPVDDGFEVVDVWNAEKVARALVENVDFESLLVGHGLGGATIRTGQVHRMGWPVSVVPAYR